MNADEREGLPPQRSRARGEAAARRARPRARMRGRCPTVACRTIARRPRRIASRQGAAQRRSRKRGGPMTLLRFIAIAIVFVLLLAVSLQNTEMATIRLFTFYVWQ